MPAISTFDLTAALLSARNEGLFDLESGSDSEASAVATFNECAGEVNGFFRDKVVAVEEMTADGEYAEGYWIARKLLSQLYYAEMATMTTGTDDGVTRAKHHAKQAASLKTELRMYISEVGNARDKSPTGPGTMNSQATLRRARERRQLKSPNRLDRMIAQNRRRY